MPKLLATVSLIIATSLAILILLMGFAGRLLPHRELAYLKEEGIGLLDIDRRLPTLLVANEGIWAFNWSLDGEQIAFASSNKVGADSDVEIYTMALDDLHIRNLSHSPRDDFAWQWSPDAGMLAYETRTQYKSDIRVVNVETGEILDHLTQIDGQNYTPYWSPNGKMLAFISEQGADEPNKYAEIRVMDVSNGKILSGLTQRIELSYGWSLAWSPDSEWLAYTHQGGDGVGIGLFILNIDTGQVRLLLSPLDFSRSSLAWSPDSQQIAFANNDWGLNELGFAVHLVNVQSGQDDILAVEEDNSLSTDEPYYPPAWSPDGKWLAFMTHDNEGGIYGMNQSDGQIYLLVPKEYYPDGSIRWSPDSQGIAFISKNRKNVYFLNMTDFTISDLTNESFISNIVWRP